MQELGGFERCIHFRTNCIQNGNRFVENGAQSKPGVDSGQWFVLVLRFFLLTTLDSVLRVRNYVRCDNTSL